MKTLFLIRHAKSSWENVNQSDFNRPLNERGHKDAPEMAKVLRGLGVVPDWIVSSPAKRAITTAQYFADEFQIPFDTIQQEEDIYEAFENDLYKIIHHLPNEKNTVLMFGHNPTFTYFANRFNYGQIDDIPTCGIVRIELDSNNWSSFREETASVAGFWYPKMV